MERLRLVLCLSLIGYFKESQYSGTEALLRSSSTQDIRKNLKYYELLHAIDFTHHIVKRGARPSSHPFNRIKELQFNTLGRDFLLVLNPNTGIFDSQFRAYEVGRDGRELPILIDRESFYEGRVFGEDDSDVRAHLEDNGVMTATIRTRNETYHIEPSWRHLKDGDHLTMITYKGSDVKYSWENDAENDLPSVPVCAYMKEGVTNSSEDGPEPDYDSILKRWKRDLSLERRSALRPHKTRCPLLLVADYRFYREMGGSSNKSTINYLISLIDRVTKIYEETQWKDKPDEIGFDGMGFVIKKIVVHSEPTMTQHGEMHYNMHMEKWDVRTLLEVFSREYTHKDFCLAHLFTDIKFEGGILGLAYVGSPRRNSVGGICTPEYFKNGYTLYLNSGLSSSRNHYGQRVITREADLVTAHEFGHNWGSEHDPDNPECSPSASQGINVGSYLMYTYSVSGYDLNNKRFSPCSLRSIRKVLLTKSERCFSEPEESFCGNLRVEGNEQCDAGLLGTEDSDACCRPNCTLRQGAVCSDKNSPCCNSCQFMGIGEKCREAQLATCEQDSRCSGTSAECPKSAPMADGTPCVDKGQCKHGRCIPYCETLGKQSCMCDKLENNNACKRCCRIHLNATCFPIEPHETLPDGTPCVQGICNRGVCERTVHDVVERFWDIIEDININRLLKFLKDNIIFTAVVVSGVVWIPASAVISYIDRKSHKLALEEDLWARNKTDLIHESDTRTVIHIRPKLAAGEHPYGINQ